MLQVATVEPGTLELLKQLQSLSGFEEYRLVGGTALALIIGHRKSVDLDLFCYGSYNPDLILDVLKRNSIEIEGLQTSSVYTGGYIKKVKVDFVKEIDGWLFPAEIIDNVRLANINDIAPMKLKAVVQRGKKRDFVDLYYLFERFSIKELLDLYRKKTGQYEVIHVLTSLSYFDDAEPDEMPVMLDRKITWPQIKKEISEKVMKFSKENL